METKKDCIGKQRTYRKRDDDGKENSVKRTQTAKSDAAEKCNSSLDIFATLDLNTSDVVSNECVQVNTPTATTDHLQTTSSSPSQKLHASGTESNPDHARTQSTDDAPVHVESTIAETRSSKKSRPLPSSLVSVESSLPKPAEKKRRSSLSSPPAPSPLILREQPPSAPDSTISFDVSGQVSGQTEKKVTHTLPTIIGMSSAACFLLLDKMCRGLGPKETHEFFRQNPQVLLDLSHTTRCTNAQCGRCIPMRLAKICHSDEEIANDLADQLSRVGFGPQNISMSLSPSDQCQKVMNRVYAEFQASLIKTRRSAAVDKKEKTVPAAKAMSALAIAHTKKEG